MRVMIVARLRRIAPMHLLAAEAARADGHEVMVFGTDIDDSVTQRVASDAGLPEGNWYRNKAGKRLWREARRFRPDCIIIWGSNWSLPPSALEQIKRRIGSTIALIEGNCRLLEPFQAETLSHCDLFFTNEPYLLPLLEMHMGKENVHYFHPGASHTVYCPAELPEEEKRFYGSEISFLGALHHPNRVEFFDSFGNKPRLKVWGFNGKSIGECWQPHVVDTLQKIKIFRASTINLDLRPERLISGISSRVFEVLLCGCFPLAEYRTGLDRHFRVGEEIEVFHNVDEAREKAEYYLEHEEERETMIRKGRERVLSEWTHTKTMRHLLGIIEQHASRLSNV